MDSYSAIVVIPARMQSSRFPGKPLADINGEKMIQRVWRLASAASRVSRVIVATDDERIMNAVEAVGGHAVMTSSSCANGTERVHAAIESLATEVDYIINLQGDSPLTPPWILDKLISVMHEERCPFATPAVALSWDQFDRLTKLREQGNSTGTTVVTRNDGYALYFSSALLPYLRSGDRSGPCPIKKHLGIYAYTPEMLAEYVALPPAELEAIEKLEQLRALAHGIPIRVVEVDLRGRSLWSVDSPEDVPIVEEIILKEGELLKETSKAG